MGEWVTVGRIVRPHGNRGQVVVAPETDFGADRFKVGATLGLWRDGRVESLTIVESRPQKGRWIVGFDRSTSIDEAETLRNAELQIPAEALHALEAGQYYAHDLVGCRVESVDGAVIGRVRSVDLAAGTPLLVVGSDRGEVLVPLAEPICRRIDLVAQVIVIDPPEGLIDLNEN
jgi:16S rRNA processing protein RimM